MSKLKTVLVFAIGYVAGSAAGRQRYEEIKAGARKVARDPRVQSAAHRAQDTVAAKAPVVAEAIKDTTTAAAAAVHDKVTSDAPDHAGGEPNPPAAANGSAPIS